MILPTKYVREGSSLLGQAGKLLARRRPGMTVSDLWAEARHGDSTISYDSYILTLDLLFAIGAVRIEDGILLWGPQ